MQAHHQRENAGLVSLVGLVLVVLSVPVSIWWWTHGVWGNFSWSFLEDAAAYVGYSQPERPLVGYAEPNTVAPAPTVSTPAAPAALDAGMDVVAEAAAAPFCPPGQAARFVLGFAELKHQLGDTIGEPLECEHPNPANGDTLQQTSTGLAMYRPSTGELNFTDGWHHWALAPGGLVAWEGQDSPPATVIGGTGVSSQPPADGRERARVANTDGVGVVLRSGPRLDARTPRGLLEGTQVTILERSGADWARVRAESSGLEGWVPSQYLAPAE
jgi:hypothetical protein